MSIADDVTKALSRDTMRDHGNLPQGGHRHPPVLQVRRLRVSKDLSHNALLGVYGTSGTEAKNQSPARS